MRQYLLLCMTVFFVSSCHKDNEQTKVQMVAKPKVVVELTMPNNQDIEITHVMARPGKIIILVRVDQIPDVPAYQVVHRYSDIEVEPHDHPYRQVVMYGSVDCMDRIEGTCFSTWKEAALHYQRDGYVMFATKE